MTNNSKYLVTIYNNGTVERFMKVVNTETGKIAEGSFLGSELIFKDHLIECIEHDEKNND